MEKNSELCQESLDFCHNLKSTEDDEDTMDREGMYGVAWERKGHIPVIDKVGLRSWRWISHKLRRHDIHIARPTLRWNP